MAGPSDGNTWRRVVASPDPVGVVEESLVELLVSKEAIVVCAGRWRRARRRRRQWAADRGVEAVVDKDRTSAILAMSIKADALLLLTDVAGVEAGFGTPDARLIGRTSIAELRRLDLPDGSMGPKVAALCGFAETTGHFAAIGSLDVAEAVLRGESGTSVVSEDAAIR